MDIKIGTLLQLETVNSDRIEKFRCKVVEQKEDIIYIDYPINVATKKTAFLLDGTELRATFQTEDKQSYAFKTHVKGRKSGNIPMIMLSWPAKSEFVKIQRREYVRVETPVDIALQFGNKNYQFIAEDISAGGVAILLDGPVTFKDGDEVVLTIALPFSNREIHYVVTNANIVRIFERDGLKIASIRLTDTDDVDQQLIVRFCFERQLLNRKKELNKFD